MRPAELAAQLRALGVRPGAVLLAHTAFRAVRPVDGGPAGLVEALRGAVGDEGTVVMPSWTGDDDSIFDPRTTPASADLGITAEIFRHWPGVVRSDHPFAFAAVGPHAAAITADPLPLTPHHLLSPVGRVHELDGQILLLGVGHDANTTIHLAEVLANVPYGVPKHCTVSDGQKAVRISYIENDHCCQRFALVDEWMRAGALQREGRAGNADARLMDSRTLVSVVRKQLVRDPLLFLHTSAEHCDECSEARASVDCGSG